MILEKEFAESGLQAIVMTAGSRSKNLHFAGFNPKYRLLLDEIISNCLDKYLQVTAEKKVLSLVDLRPITIKIWHDGNKKNKILSIQKFLYHHGEENVQNIKKLLEDPMCEVRHHFEIAYHDQIAMVAKLCVNHAEHILTCPAEHFPFPDVVRDVSERLSGCSTLGSKKSVRSYLINYRTRIINFIRAFPDNNNVINAKEPSLEAEELSGPPELPSTSSRMNNSDSSDHKTKEPHLSLSLEKTVEITSSIASPSEEPNDSCESISSEAYLSAQSSPEYPGYRSSYEEDGAKEILTDSDHPKDSPLSSLSEDVSTSMMRSSSHSDLHPAYIQYESQVTSVPMISMSEGIRRSSEASLRSTCERQRRVPLTRIDPSKFLKGTAEQSMLKSSMNGSSTEGNNSKQRNKRQRDAMDNWSVWTVIGGIWNRLKGEVSPTFDDVDATPFMSPARQIFPKNLSTQATFPMSPAGEIDSSIKNSEISESSATVEEMWPCMIRSQPEGAEFSRNQLSLKTVNRQQLRVVLANEDEQQTSPRTVKRPRMSSTIYDGALPSSSDRTFNATMHVVESMKPKGIDAVSEQNEDETLTQDTRVLRNKVVNLSTSDISLLQRSPPRKKFKK